MIRNQVYLTEAKKTGLAAIARSKGLKQSELILKAIDRLPDVSSESNRQEVLNAAEGMWRDRNNLPIRERRTSWDRES